MHEKKAAGGRLTRFAAGSGQLGRNLKKQRKRLYISPDVCYNNVESRDCIGAFVEVEEYRGRRMHKLK